MLKIILMQLLFAYALLAQESTVMVDTTASHHDSTEIAHSTEMSEFFLETIRIEAVVEKPSVALIPKKVETSVGELPFERRSFEKELNALPEQVPEIGAELERGKKMDNLKKSLAKDK